MPDAVLLPCHGTIESLSDLPAFLQNVRRGRPVPDELLEEVRRRYERVGPSPLLATSREQARLLSSRLELPVAVAGRLWHPYPAEVLAELRAQGITRVLSLPLAPQSVHVYNASVVEAAEPLGMAVLQAPMWGTDPGLLTACRETIREALADDASPKPVPVLLSAHSLPLRILASGDPYEKDFRAMAEAVAADLREEGRRVDICFQSQGATNDAWLGPTLEEAMRTLHEAGHDELVVAPIGFLAEHVETLYDLDVEASELAARIGFRRFRRAPAVGTRKGVLDALERVARAAFAT